MKSTVSTLGILGLMGAVALGAGLGTANAAEKRLKSMLRPGAGVSFDVGKSHAMAYFVPSNGVCNLTMVMSEIVGEDEMPTSAGTRVNASIEGGKRARIDTPEGKSVEFICAPGATMVSLRKVEMLAYTPARPRG